MTTSDNDRSFRYEGNGSTDAFAFPARIFTTGDLVVEIITRATDVLEETLTITTDYTVVINSEESATVTTVAGKIPSATQDIQIRSTLAQTQTVDLPTGTVFPAKSVEDALDRVTVIVQEASEDIDRAVKLPVTSSLSNIELPIPVASEVIGWNSGGTNLTSYSFAEVSSALDAVFGSITSGDLIRYNGTNWVNVAELGTSNIGDNAINGTKIAMGSDAQGDVLYYDGTNYARLGAGTSGQLFQTNGAGANPSWVNAPAFSSTDITGQSNATIAAGDQIVFADADDSSNLKEDTVQGILDLVPASTPTLVAPRATTSGSTDDFGSIPSGTKRITVVIEAVSLSGANRLGLQLGDAGGIETTGYSGAATSNSGTQANSTFFNITQGGPGAAQDTTAILVLTLADSSNNTWAVTGTSGQDDGGAAGSHVWGLKSLSAELTQVRLMNSASDTFDAGQWSIMYE